MIDDLVHAMGKAIGEMRAWPDRTAHPLSSQRPGRPQVRRHPHQGLRTRRPRGSPPVSLEKPYPEVLEGVYAGKGGYMVALTPGRELQDRVAAQMEREGFAVIRATIG